MQPSRAMRATIRVSRPGLSLTFRSVTMSVVSRASTSGISRPEVEKSTNAREQTITVQSSIRSNGVRHSSQSTQRIVAHCIRSDTRIVPIGSAIGRYGTVALSSNNQRGWVETCTLSITFHLRPNPWLRLSTTRSVIKESSEIQAVAYITPHKIAIQLSARHQSSVDCSTAV